MLKGTISNPRWVRHLPDWSARCFPHPHTQTPRDALLRATSYLIPAHNQRSSSMTVGRAHTVCAARWGREPRFGPSHNSCRRSRSKVLDARQRAHVAVRSGSLCCRRSSNRVGHDLGIQATALRNSAWSLLESYGRSSQHGRATGSVSSRAFLAKYDDEQEISQAACRMPSAIWAALVNRERRAVAETVWL
jgi:hypothetical protein